MVSVPRGGGVAYLPVAVFFSAGEVFFIPSEEGLLLCLSVIVKKALPVYLHFY